MPPAAFRESFSCAGQLSHEYFDKYLFESDPQLLRRVCEAMVALIPSRTELLGGLELGGVPLATVMSQLCGIPTLFVRKAAKSYGTCRLAEGADVAGKTITLVEDVITTGGAVRDAAQALRGQNAYISTVICAINRSNAPTRVLAEASLSVRSVLTKEDLDNAQLAATE